MSTTKLLTGQMIHDSFLLHVKPKDAVRWDALEDHKQEAYNTVAKHLNEDLGLCSDCGERPIAPNTMLEIAGDMVCQKCCHTPTPESNPELQFMHMITNASQEPIGVITAPAGMSLEDFKKQLTEEMSHISFMLEYDSAKYASKTIPELTKSINEYIPAATGAQEHEYFITVLKDSNEAGQGWYKCTADNTFEVIDENHDAEGLMGAIEEYAWNERILNGSTIL